MSMPADRLLPRLDKVRQRTPDSWMARCPAHADNGPSLSIRECEDGRLLLRCFSGCETASVVHALGLELSDLFPPKPSTDYPSKPRRRPPILAWDVVHALRHDLTLIAVAASDASQGKLSPDTLRALSGSALHLADLLEAAHVIR